MRRPYRGDNPRHTGYGAAAEVRAGRVVAGGPPAEKAALVARREPTGGRAPSARVARTLRVTAATTADGLPRRRRQAASAWSASAPAPAGAAGPAPASVAAAVVG